MNGIGSTADRARPFARPKTSGLRALGVSAALLAGLAGASVMAAPCAQAQDAKGCEPLVSFEAAASPAAAAWKASLAMLRHDPVAARAYDVVEAAARKKPESILVCPDRGFTGPSESDLDFPSGGPAFLFFLNAQQPVTAPAMLDFLRDTAIALEGGSVSRSEKLDDILRVGTLRTLVRLVGNVKTEIDLAMRDNINLPFEQALMSGMPPLKILDALEAAEGPDEDKAYCALATAIWINPDFRAGMQDKIYNNLVWSFIRDGAASDHLPKGQTIISPAQGAAAFTVPEATATVSAAILAQAPWMAACPSLLTDKTHDPSISDQDRSYAKSRMLRLSRPAISG